MTANKQFELPDDLKPAFRRASRLEWITVGYLANVTVVMYLVSANSQAMKVAWIEDALSMIPSIAFLTAAHIYNKKPDKFFPYGYHRVFTIAFLVGSVALFSIGLFLITDSVITLAKTEHPSIGAFSVGDRIVWMGWLMYGALLYSSVPSIFLGLMKQPLAKKLHNKVLFTDADTQKADWMTALAAMVGITGIGFGLWWADSAAAIFISASVTKSGFDNLKNAITHLMDRSPKTTDHKKEEPLLIELQNHLASIKGIKEFSVRFRENGQVFFGEVYFKPDEGTDVVGLGETIHKKSSDLHWKLFDISAIAVRELPEKK